ncbi:MAG: hypothetical protein M0P02_02160 [Sulfurospirillaceae bacterium]|nr:hypothetical protein [Sulfurospirillaceae bacterium]MCK9546012.1 hypothetical protein [Sulfurospirillaceae bacterium]MDY0237652.1 hypothetical protein [Campylobacterales bacterium]
MNSLTKNERKCLDELFDSLYPPKNTLLMRFFKKLCLLLSFKKYFNKP